jgi:hypothetical protein
LTVLRTPPPSAAAVEVTMSRFPIDHPARHCIRTRATMAVVASFVEVMRGVITSWNSYQR